MATGRVSVIGGGLAGLMTTIKICELGVPVDLFSFVPVKRSHSVCAQGGINGAVNTKGEGDHPDIHFKDSCKGGDYLADQPLVKGMCYAAPGIIYLLDRMGVPFNRTPEGLIDFRRFGGTLHHRTAFAGATTGQQLLYALDEQVRRFESEGLVKKYEGWEFLGLVKDDAGIVRGHICANLLDLSIHAFRADAVNLCTGGPGLVFGKSTQSMICNGTAAGAAYQQGAIYANGEFIQVHPTAIPADDKLRLMSESLRGEGGRVWVPKDGKPWYFLEERYPKFKNLVPRDIATREIFQVVREMKLGVDGKDQVYLDVSHIPEETLRRKLEGVIEIYEKFVGDNPAKVPMRVFPAVHYSMGGLWCGYKAGADGFPIVGAPENHQTNIAGLFTAGEADSQYHGANRLGANSLLSCIYSGMIGGPAMVSWRNSMEKGADAAPSSLFDAEKKRWEERFTKIKGMRGKENPYRMWRELGEMMTSHVTVIRNNKDLKVVTGTLDEMSKRWNDIDVLDTGSVSNQAAPFVNQLWNMLELAKVIAHGALARNESRGAHYTPEFPDRNDDQWMKATMASWTANGPKLDYKAVDISLQKPEARKYG